MRDSDRSNAKFGYEPDEFSPQENNRMAFTNLEVKHLA